MSKQDSTVSSGVRVSTIESVKTNDATITTVVREPASRMLQNFILFWLDSSFDESKQDFKKSLTELQDIAKTIRTHTNAQTCLQEMKEFNNENMFLIVSGALGQTVVPEIEQWSQLDSIYIFCNNKAYHEKWTKKHPIIKGVHTEIKPICDALRFDLERCDRNMISIAFHGVDPLFMYTQLIKEAMLEIKDDNSTSVKDLAQYCRRQKKIPENEIQFIEREYDHHPPIWWYTAPYFLYSMLNRALRMFDVEIILKMAFFIRQLHHNIETLHSEQRASSSSSIKTAKQSQFKVYRGQGLAIKDFETLKKTKGGQMSFNNFLSTSYNREISLEMFARQSVRNTDCVGILFTMNIDAQLCQESNIPFVEIVGDLGYFKADEQEVLFTTHTIFQIEEIKRISDSQTDKLYQVDLTLINPNTHELKRVTQSIREEFRGHTGWRKLSYILLKVGQTKQAEQLCRLLLEVATEENEIAEYNFQLGWVNNEHGAFEKAIEHYEICLEHKKKSLPSNHPDLASGYNNIGNVYRHMGEYSKALSFYEKSLEIRKKSLPPNHPHFGTSYDNIGIVHRNLGQYSKALSLHEKSLEIRKQSLPSNHPDLAVSHSHIAVVLYEMGEYKRSLEFYEKTLEIQKQVLPLNHPELAACYNNTGIVYYRIGEYAKSLLLLEKAFEIWKQNLPSNHPNFSISYTWIGNVYSALDENSKAVSFHEKALAIQKESLPPNHPDLGHPYNNMGIAYKKMGEYSKAISFHEHALQIWQNSLPPGHPNIALAKRNIQDVKNKL